MVTGATEVTDSLSHCPLETGAHALCHRSLLPGACGWIFFQKISILNFGYLECKNSLHSQDCQGTTTTTTYHYKSYDIHDIISMT